MQSVLKGYHSYLNQIFDSMGFSNYGVAFLCVCPGVGTTVVKNFHGSDLPYQVLEYYSLVWLSRCWPNPIRAELLISNPKSLESQANFPFSSFNPSQISLRWAYFVMRSSMTEIALPIALIQRSFMVSVSLLVGPLDDYLDGKH